MALGSLEFQFINYINVYDKEKKSHSIHDSYHCYAILAPC